MEITKEDKRSVIDHCYLTYFISGMVILIFGVILPNLIEERNLSFTAAGGLLSFLAIGNLCSSLVYPVFCGMMSQKTAVVVLAVPYPVCLFLFTMGLPVPVLYVMIFLIGITKGMITIINNHAIRQVTGSSNQYLNLLHMWYAVGAFLSPFVTMLLMGAGMNWKTILRLLAVLTVLIVLSYATMDYRKIEKEVEKKAGEENGGSSMTKEKFWFLKNTGFLLAVGHCSSIWALKTP
jgi:FHS family glucose/mannose:H+ symporter-like MFS transporter